MESHFILLDFVKRRKKFKKKHTIEFSLVISLNHYIAITAESKILEFHKSFVA